MPLIVTGNGTCEVESPDGTRNNCAFPLITSTDECSDKVKIGGHGVVRQGDRVTPHLRVGCNPSNMDISALTTFSSKVKVEGRGVARVGDFYAENEIKTGQSKINVE